MLRTSDIVGICGGVEGRMIQIETGNSYSKITGLCPAQEKGLREELSYTVNAQAAFFAGGNYPRRRSLLDRQGSFPTGLLGRVEAYLQKLNLGSTRRLEMRSSPPHGNVNLKADFKDLVPYPDQLEAMEAVVRNGQACLSAPTGSGKSLIIALIINRLRVRTLIVVPTLEIKRQLTEVLTGIFGPNKHITIENIGSNALKKATDYDCLILDEVHHAASKTYQKLNKTAWTGIYFRACLTATPFRNQTEETLLYEGIAGPVRYQLSFKDAVSKGYIVPLEAYYFEVPKQPTDAFTYAEVYSDLVVNNDERNKLISDLLLSLDYQGVSTLCLVKEIAHGEALKAITGHPFVNGEDEESRKYIQQFNDGKITCLIGTTGVLGEGCDTKPCEYVVIAGLGKSKVTFMQQVGRALRRFTGKESAKVIIIKDPSHRFTTRHFREQCRILKEEYGIIPSKIYP